MNKQQLANKIWESANKMRSKIEANDYKDYILGFIFYKYLSDNQVKMLLKEGYDKETLKTVTEEDPETVEYVQNNIGYFISYEHLYSTWLESGKDFDVSNVRDALSAFSRNVSRKYEEVFVNIFHTLETGLSKLGENSGKQTQAIRDLLELIKDIPTDGKQSYDVLGFIYEYLISQFAANAGKKAGEFYTPHEVSVLMSEIVAEHLKDEDHIEIYDPTSGSGSLLINIGESVSERMKNKGHIKYYAQELKENTYNLTRMNLVMRGINPSNIKTRNGDTLEEDWPNTSDDANAPEQPIYVHAVVSNPPYSQQWNPEGKDQDPRYNRFGLAPKTKADYAFLLHDLYHLRPEGIMTIVLPHGVLFRGGEEGTIRKNLIENNHLDAIIGLPANIFFGTGIPTVVLVLKQKRDNSDVLIVDASKEFAKEGKNNVLKGSHIKKIVDTVVHRKGLDKYAKVVSKEEIRENEYNLNIPRYVDSSEAAESWDIYASMFGGIPKSEIEGLQEYWDTLPNLKNSIFVENGTPYVELVDGNVKEIINKHEDITKFNHSYRESFAGFAEYLQKSLIGDIMSVEVVAEKTKVAEEIFRRFENISLVDRYAAYQVFENQWNAISEDMEMIQSEGFDCTRKVDPNLVIKKKSGKEVEVQEGWKGHILPFELVQSAYLEESLEAVRCDEQLIGDIPNQLEELMDTLTEDEKESVLNDDNTAFDKKALAAKKKELKGTKDNEELDMLAKIDKALDIYDIEKNVKKRIKEQLVELETLTKEKVESLTDEEVKELLDVKWVLPIIAGISELSITVISDLSTKVENLASKYGTTYLDTQAEIKECETLLSSMIDDLVGDEFDMKGLSKFKSLLGGE